MDRYEFNLKMDQFKKLIEKRDYEVAAKIADSFELHKIKTVSLLTTIADVYEVTGQYEKAKEVLEIAFDKSSMGRQIAYKLTALSAKLGQIRDAKEYYDEYVTMSPNNPSRYLLEYEIAKAENKDLTELITILEKYVQEDMDEKWTYVLAVLYHKAGMGQKCVELCDTITLWFNGGKFVKRALDLKMLYVPLSSEQQELLDGKSDDEKAKRMKYTEENAQTVIFAPVKPDENQKEVADGTANETTEETPEYYEGGNQVGLEGKEAAVEAIFGTTAVVEEEKEPERPAFEVELEDDTLEEENSITKELEPIDVPEENDDEATAEVIAENESLANDDKAGDEAGKILTEEEIAKSVSEVAENDNLMRTTEIDFRQIQVKEIDVNNQYNTINLQAEIAESMAAILGNDYKDDGKFSGPTKELDAFDTAFYNAITPERVKKEEPVKEIESVPEKYHKEDYIFYTSTDPINPLYELEGDGQVGFSAPEPKKDDDQLEGQLTIEDILAEYERMNQAKEESETVEEAAAAEAEPIVEEVATAEAEQTVEVSGDSELSSQEIEEMLAAVEEESEVDENVLISEEIEIEKHGVIKDEYKEIHEKKVASSVDSDALRAMFAEDATGPIEIEVREVVVPEPVEETVPEDVIPMQESEAEAMQEEVTAEEPVPVTEPEVVVPEPTVEPVVVVPVPIEPEEIEVKEVVVPEPAEEPVPVAEQEVVIPEPIPEPEVQENVQEKEDIEEKDLQEEKPKKKKTLKIAKDEATKVDLKKDLKNFINKYGALTGLDNEIIKVLESLVKEYDKDLTSKTNNVFVTGKLRSGKTTMARDLIKLVNKLRHRDGRKVAKTNAIILNQKGVKFALSNLDNVDVIVEKAGSLNTNSVKELISVLGEYTNGMIVILEDEKSAQEQMFARYPALKDIFSNVISIKEFTLKDWADYAKNYVEEKGFEIDDMAMLALHAELDKIYSNARTISKEDVEDLMDEVMENANKGIGKFFKRLFGKSDDDIRKVIKEEHFY